VIIQEQKKVQMALKEAILSLPREEYYWFGIYPEGRGRSKSPVSQPSTVSGSAINLFYLRTLRYFPDKRVFPSSGADN